MLLNIEKSAEKDKKCSQEWLVNKCPEVIVENHPKETSGRQRNVIVTSFQRPYSLVSFLALY